MPDSYSIEEVEKLKKEGKAKPVMDLPDSLSLEDIQKLDQQGLVKPVEQRTSWSDIGKAVGLSLAQGATAGLEEEVISGIQAAGDVASSFLGFRGDIDFPTAYKTRVGAARRLTKEAQSKAPILSAGAEIVGSVPMSLAPVFAPAKGASFANVLGKAGLAGGAVGFGKSEADLVKGGSEEVIQVGKDILTGAGISAATAGVLNRLATAPETLRRFGAEKATKSAIGNQAKFYKMLAGKDAMQKRALINQAVKEGADPDEVAKVIKLFEDNAEAVRVGEKLLKDKVVGFGSGSESIGLKALVRRQSAGNEMGKIINQVDDVIGGPSISGNSLRDKFLNAAADLGDDPQQASKVKTLLKNAEFFEGKEYTLRELQNLKNKSFKFKPGDPDSMSAGQAVMNKMERILSDEISDKVSEKGGKELAAKFGSAKKDFGDYNLVSDSALSLASRQSKNQSFGLTDKILFAGDIASGGVGVKGALLAGANKVLRERGNSAAAVSLTKLGDILEKSPELLGAFKDPLAKAMKEGPSAFAAAHLLFMKDPEYRKTIGADDNALQRRARRK